MERAVITLGQVLAERTSADTLPLRFVDDLREIDMGVLHGTHRQVWPDAIDAGRGVGARARHPPRSQVEDYDPVKRAVEGSREALDRTLLNAERGTPLVS